MTGALAVASVSFGVWKQADLRRAETRYEDAERQRSELATELGRIKQRLEIANQRLAESEMKAASLKDDFSQLFSAKQPAAPAPPANPSSIAQQGFVVGGGYRTGPAAFRLRPPAKALDTTYHALYRQLKLSKPEIDRFKSVMTEATTRFEELDFQARQRRVSVMDKSLQPQYAAVDSNLRANLTEHFGSEVLPVIERFSETLFLRDAVSPLAGDLFYTETPLTEAQANQLVDVLAKHMRDPAGRLNPTFADPAAMKANAAEVLSPPQLEIWHELIDHLRKTSFASLNRPRR